MRRIACLLLLSVCAAVFSAEGLDVKVEVCGVCVVAPASSNPNDNWRAFHGMPGTNVALLFKTDKLSIIRFDHINSALTKFSDDKGSNLLLKDEKNRFSTQGFNAFPNLADDGKRGIFEVGSAQLPAKGATRLSLEGSAILTCGAAKKEFENKDVALKPGSKIAGDKLSLTLSKAEKADWNGKKYQVSFHASQKLDSLADVRFYKADGTEIKSSQINKSEGGSGDKWSSDVSYGLAEAVETATIKIMVWTDLQTITVPINVTASLGL
jgi:hypothetical protein